MAKQQQPLIVLMEDPIIHTTERPFCGDPSCPYSEGPALIVEVHAAIEQGLITPEEALLIIQGKNPLVCGHGSRQALSCVCSVYTTAWPVTPRSLN